MDTLPNFFAQMLLTGKNKGSFELTESLLYMPKEIATVQITPGWPKLVLRAKWASDGEEYKNPCSGLYTDRMEFAGGIYKGGLLDYYHPHGFGELKYEDGECYKGTWLNGRRHGSGK